VTAQLLLDPPPSYVTPRLHDHVTPLPPAYTYSYLCFIANYYSKPLSVLGFGQQKWPIFADFQSVAVPPCRLSAPI